MYKTWLEYIDQLKKWYWICQFVCNMTSKILTVQCSGKILCPSICRLKAEKCLWNNKFWHNICLIISFPIITMYRSSIPNLAMTFWKQNNAWGEPLDHNMCLILEHFDIENGSDSVCKQNIYGPNTKLNYVRLSIENIIRL